VTGRSDALDHATSEIASSSELGVNATKKWPGGLQAPLAAAHQDGCGGEGERGKAVQAVGDDVRRL
jgi:hypothetical protein